MLALVTFSMTFMILLLYCSVLILILRYTKIRNEPHYDETTQNEPNNNETTENEPNYGKTTQTS